MTSRVANRVIDATPDGQVILCEVSDINLEDVELQADEADLASVEGMRGRRRSDRLIWRGMARRLIDNRPLEVEYTVEGAPRINNYPYTHISVSHCNKAIALAVSQCLCGIDVECLDRNFRKVAPRYITPEEWLLKPTEDVGAANSTNGSGSGSASAEGEDIEQMFLATVWCAKECLFKMYGRRGLDLCHDICVESIDLEQGVVAGHVKGHPQVMMKIVKTSDYIVVYHK